MAVGRKTGGRTKGTPNKATADVRAAAQGYTAQAIATLASIMRSDDQPAPARVAAARELLDRGHGKSVQAVEMKGEIVSRRELSDAELLAIATGSGQGAAGEADGESPSDSVH